MTEEWQATGEWRKARAFKEQLTQSGNGELQIGDRFWVLPEWLIDCILADHALAREAGRLKTERDEAWTAAKWSGEIAERAEMEAERLRAALQEAVPERGS